MPARGAAVRRRPTFAVDAEHCSHRIAVGVRHRSPTKRLFSAQYLDEEFERFVQIRDVVPEVIDVPRGGNPVSD